MVLCSQIRFPDNFVKIRQAGASEKVILWESKVIPWVVGWVGGSGFDSRDQQEADKFVPSDSIDSSYIDEGLHDDIEGSGKYVTHALTLFHLFISTY